MKYLSLLIAMLSILIPVNSQNISLNDINSGKFSSKNTGTLTPSADGKHFYKINPQKTQINKYDFKTGQIVSTLFDVNTARNSNIESIDGFLVSPDEKKIILFTNTEPIYRRSTKSTLYYYNVNRNYIEKLTQNSVKQSAPKFSHDSSMLIYAADNDIWLVKFDFDTESKITNDGKINNIINGTTDWVYEEEFSTTNIIDFSADDTLIAFVRFDESDVDDYSLQIFDQLYPRSYVYKYPKAGTQNSKIACKVYDINSKTLREINLPQNTEYIPKIEFFPEGDDLAIFTLNRQQNNLAVYAANAKSLLPKEIISETNHRYVNPELLSSIFFIGDKIVLLSEQDGFQHIYLHNKNGVLEKQLTQGNYDVTQILGINENTGDIFFQAAKTTPLEREIYKVNVKNGAIKQLTTQKGVNNAKIANGGEFFINIFSNANTPSEITIKETNTGKTVYTLEDNKNLKNQLTSLNLPSKEFTTFKAADHQTDLNGFIIKPYNFNPSKKYPVVMVQYSGPGSQSVMNRYEMDWTTYLANHGYIVVCVDGRGTGARGEDFKKNTYMNLGIIESDDQIAVANQLKQLPYTDGNRIGIWGWSYGGYNTLMSMSRGNGIFKSGVAIAPVTDWKFYDTVYGERFMRTPQENPIGYENSSAINHVKDLQGELLLIHGTADDNVHVQNTMEYLKAAIDASKNVDLFLFPDKDHSILGLKNRNYIYNKVIKHFDETL